MSALPVPRFDTFYRYEELSQLLHDYAAAAPGLVRVASIGKSHEGRDIWVATVTNFSTGDDTDKPAFWADGNIHAAELTASTACLYYLHQLVIKFGSDRDITQLLDTRVVYLCPRLNPDGAELALADKPRHIRSSTRPYPFDEDTVEGLTIEDVDGDGRMLTMRVPDPHGTYKKHPQEPRLMVPREPGEFGGEYYRLMPEGTLTHWDGLTVNVNRDLEGLDLNRNFPTNWRGEHEQLGAGPYPTSEPEVRAMVDFIVKHPNIGAAISYHTHSGVILRPMGSKSDDDMAPEDLWSIKRFSALGEKLSGYPAISIWHEFKYHPKDVISGTQDWVYEHLGALFWVVEIWSPNKEAGITDYKWIDWYREHPVDDDLKLLAWSDKHCQPPSVCRLAAVQASAVGRGRDRRLGQDELLAQPAAAPARARSGALSGVDDADRAVAAETGDAAHRSARPGQRHLAHPLRGRQHRLPAGLRDPSRARTQGRARRDVRDPLARASGRVADQRQAPLRRAAARRACAEDEPAGVLAVTRSHCRSRRGGVGGEGAEGDAHRPDGARGSGGGGAG